MTVGEVISVTYPDADVSSVPHSGVTVGGRPV